MSKNQCSGSGTRKIVSDGEINYKETKCPACSNTVKFTIPDPILHANTVKIKPHKGV